MIDFRPIGFRVSAVLLMLAVGVAMAADDAAAPAADATSEQAESGDKKDKGDKDDKKEPAGEGEKGKDDKKDEKGKIPGVKVDMEKRLVDVEATVVARRGEWLELLACKVGTKEHESVLTLKAQASHVHLGLLLIGLKPGKPAVWEKVGDEIKMTQATGDKVAVSIVFTNIEGKVVEMPANQWILNKKTGKPLEDNIWIFAGSSMFRDEREGKEYYRADLNGTMISIVNFGDELLARPTDTTDRTDEENYGPLTANIPAVGDAVIVRLRPVEEKKESKKE